MARPPLPADERRTYKLQISFTEPERQCIESAADSASVTFSEFVRDAGLAQARHNADIQRRRSRPLQKLVGRAEAMSARHHELRCSRCYAAAHRSRSMLRPEPTWRNYVVTRGKTHRHHVLCLTCGHKWASSAHAAQRFLRCRDSQPNLRVFVVSSLNNHLAVY